MIVLMKQIQIFETTNKSVASVCFSIIVLQRVKTFVLQSWLQNILIFLAYYKCSTLVSPLVNDINDPMVIDYLFIYPW